MINQRFRFPGPRFHRDVFGDLWIDGQFYMGRMRVPPMPPRIALIDRTTGETRVLSHDGANVVLEAPTARMTDIQNFGSHGGPYSGNWRLYLNSGTLAFEYAEGYNSAKILTRRNFDKQVLEITADDTGQVVTTAYDL